MTRQHAALVALVLLVGPPRIGALFGADKLKHFFTSALVQSAAYSSLRAAGVGRSNAQLIGGVSTAAVGFWKEVHDKRQGKPFSVADLIWDAAGGTAAAGLLNGTR